MIETSLKEQITTNIGAGEEIHFSLQPDGLQIRRIHGDKELTLIVSRIELDTIRDFLVDGWLGEMLWEMAVELRGQSAKGRQRRPRR